MQVDPIKPTLKAPGTKRLKLKCDILLSTSAFKFNLRRYTEQAASAVVTANGRVPTGGSVPLVIRFADSHGKARRATSKAGPGRYHPPPHLPRFKASFVDSKCTASPDVALRSSSAPPCSTLNPKP